MQQSLPPIIALLLTWIISAYLVNPGGDFPLNDDWQYAFPVKTLLQNGSYEMNSEIAPNIFSQVVWGYLFCQITGGFSFYFLRLSTLVLGIFTVTTAYFFHKKAGTVVLALLSAGLLAFNPLFYVLSFSFMSDVPFLFFALLSIFFYSRFFDLSKTYLKVLAAIFSVLAFFVRQQGILILVSFELVAIIQKARNNNYFPSNWLWFFFGITTYSWTELWLKPWLGVEANYISVAPNAAGKIQNSPFQFLFDLGVRLLMILYYVGFFTLPLSYLIAMQFKKVISKYGLILGLVMLSNLIISLLAYFSLGRVFPFGGNIFYNLGLGPELLYDNKQLGMVPVRRISQYGMVLLGWLCQVNGTLLLIVLAKITRLDNSNLFVILIGVLYCLSSTILSFFDRYTLLPFMLILHLFFKSIKKIDKATFCWSLPGLLLFAYFSVVGTHDYLSRNRLVKKWEIEMMETGISRQEIDSGHANNRWAGVNPTESTYHILSRPVTGYRIIQTKEYYSWIWWREVSLFLGVE